VIFQQYLPGVFEEEAKELFFFHRDQSRYRPQILGCIERFGAPEIRFSQAGITLALKGFSGGQQGWFLTPAKGCAPILCILILAVDDNTLSVVHWVNRLNADSSDLQALVMRQIISLAQRLKGVIRIRIEYAGVEMTLDRAERLFSN